MFFLRLFFYFVFACTSSEDLQISYSQETSNEPASQSPSQEDTDSERETEFNWDTIPESILSLKGGVHRVSWQVHDVYVSVPSTYMGDDTLALIVLLHGGRTALPPIRQKTSPLN